MAKAPSMLDDVTAGLRDRRGPQTWVDTLPPDIAAEVRDIKAKWQSGKLATTKTALSHSLAKVLTARGVNIGHSGVLRWLEKT